MGNEHGLVSPPYPGAAAAVQGNQYQRAAAQSPRAFLSGLAVERVTADHDLWRLLYFFNSSVSAGAWWGRSGEGEGGSWPIGRCHSHFPLGQLMAMGFVPSALPAVSCSSEREGVNGFPSRSLCC